MTDDEIDGRLELILHAAGSGLYHYTMSYSRERLRAAMRKALDLEWQPIETAPMNMTPIWIKFTRGPHTMFAHALYVPRFTEENDSDNSEYCEEKDHYYTIPDWYEVCFSAHDYSAYALDGEPTHWMPLPESPVPSEKASS